MIKFKLLALTVFTVFFISCATTKTHTPGPESEDTSQVIMDSVRVNDTTEETEYPYHPAEERKWDLLHTMLDLSFDWPTSTVIGTATLTLTPLFYPQSELKLNAVDFNIKKVMVGDKVISDFKYDSNEITIPFAQPMARRDRVIVTIEYTASPKAGTIDEDAAVTSDQGLFFIDPLDTLPDVPKQIWSQGETSSNRKWFPTLDQPNERATQEIIMTVPDTFMTLSNGLLISSTSLPGGLRRDHWKLELPIAPYLTMIAVGQWDKVTDYWRGRPVDYYVDRGYGPDARAIFAHTPEMIEFFSQKLGFDYVWPKYAQVIVKDFVSGAMENVSATVFGDFIQFHDDDMITSGSNDYIVSHELFHHWFGDLVTCESWANITLNEGFADYAEYLWSEYKYGHQKADLARMTELSGYLEAAHGHAHPLIYYHYPNENAVFDAHSYNKGSLVLHMLRDLVGDEAFFGSLRLYLQQHAYTAVEAADLRQSFEEVTGMDLNWFFDQWFFAKGHPVLDVQQNYDEQSKQITVDITQTQEGLGYKDVFRLPVEIGIYYDGGSHDTHQVWLDEKTKSFSWSVKAKPAAVIIDPRDVLLAEVTQEISESENVARLLFAPAVSRRINAFNSLSEIPVPIMEIMEEDTSDIIRGLAIQYYMDHKNADRLYAMSKKEKDPEQKYNILQAMTELDPAHAKELGMQLLDSTQKTPIIYAALKAIGEVDIDEALRQASRYEHNPSPAIYAARAELFAKKGSGASLEFFKDDRAKNLPLDYLEDFVSALVTYLSTQPQSVQNEGLELINSEFYMQGPNKQYRRFYLIVALATQYSELHEGTFKTGIHGAIKNQYAKETNEYLKQALKQGLGEELEK